MAKHRFIRRLYFTLPLKRAQGTDCGFVDERDQIP